MYLKFKGIKEDSFRSVITFYESKRSDIARLEFAEQFELLVDYSDALFESGSHHKHLIASEEIILASIDQNIQYHKERDIYRDTLFRRAASYFQLKMYGNARHVLKELIKMFPEDRTYFLLLIRTFTKEGRKILRHTRAICIFLCLVSAAITAIELLLIKNFYPLYVSTFVLIRTLALLLGLCAFFVPEIIQLIIACRKAIITRKNLFT